MRLFSLLDPRRLGIRRDLEVQIQLHSLSSSDPNRGGPGASLDVRQGPLLAIISFGAVAKQLA